ncbi:MAG: site-specific integrase [Chitinispirillales bacterium]|jgi:integrase|nr:site-specific integrase [Chitinispirillales bacterium]
MRKNSRNAAGSGTIRQRPDGRWEARLVIGHDSGTGKQIRKSFYFKTQKEARQKLQSTAVEIDNGAYTEPSKMTIAQWLDLWIETYLGNVKPLTVTSYTSQININIKPNIGAIKLTALTAPDVQAFYNKLESGTDEKKPLSPKTIKNIHGVLHKALNQAVKLGYIKANPTAACVLPRWIRKEIQPLEETEISAFLKAVQGHKFESVYMVTLFTGIRQGEVLGISWTSVDFERGTIFIHQQLQKQKDKTTGKWIYHLVPLKNDKTRTITPAPYIMGILKSHKAKQAETQSLAGEAWNNTDNLVFTDEIGGHLKHVTVYKNYKKIVADLGLEEARFHDLRHSYAVAALQAGDDIKTVQENLGHHTAAFTLDVYGHVSERMKQESANRMEKFIQSVV